MSSFFLEFCHSFDWLSNFVNYSYNYRPNRTPLGPITITNMSKERTLTGRVMVTHVRATKEIINGSVTRNLLNRSQSTLIINQGVKIVITD